MDLRTLKLIKKMLLDLMYFYFLGYLFYLNLLSILLCASSSTVHSMETEHLTIILSYWLYDVA